MAEYPARSARDRAQSFLIRRAREVRGPVLQLFSGSGELARSLSDVGLEVVGVEPSGRGSVVHLDGARRMQVLDADPRAVRLSRRFGLVLAVGSALPRAGSPGALDALFATAAAHLGKDGALLIEVGVLGPRKRGGERVSMDPETGIFRGVRSEPRARHAPPAPHLGRRAGAREAISRLELLAVPAAEILRRLEHAGLSVREAYGDFEEQALESDSQRLICVARRRT